MISGHSLNCYFGCRCCCYCAVAAVYRSAPLAPANTAHTTHTARSGPYSAALLCCCSPWSTEWYLVRDTRAANAALPRSFRSRSTSASAPSCSAASVAAASSAATFCRAIAVAVAAASACCVAACCLLCCIVQLPLQLLLLLCCCLLCCSALLLLTTRHPKARGTTHTKSATHPSAQSTVLAELCAASNSRAESAGSRDGSSRASRTVVGRTECPAVAPAVAAGLLAAFSLLPSVLLQLLHCCLLLGGCCLLVLCFCSLLCCFCCLLDCCCCYQHGSGVADCSLRCLF
jgi:hypothetical protein